MKLETSKTTTTLNVSYHLTAKEQEILRAVNINGRIDFNQLKFGESNALDESRLFYFEDCSDLIKYDFLEEDTDEHYTFIFTDLGADFVKYNSHYQEQKSFNPCCYKCGTEIKWAREWGIPYHYCPNCKEDRQKNGEKHPHYK